MNQEKPKKICHIIFKHRPFDGRIFQKEVQSLRGAGYEMTVVLPRLNRRSVGRRQEIAVAGVEREYRFQDVRFIPYWYHRKMTKKFGLRRRLCKRSLMSALVHAQADAYHFHEDEISLEVAAELKSRLPGARLVFDFHESFDLQHREMGRTPEFIRSHREREERMLAAADLVVTVSDVISGRYRTRTAAPVITVMNCQSEAIFRAGTPQLPDDGTFWVVHEGSIGFDRGLDYIMDVARLVSRPEIRFLIIGGMKKDARTYFETRMERHGIQNRFFRTGLLPYDEVAGYLCAGKVGLDFRVTENAQTGIANKFFNYLRFGIPVLAFPNACTDPIIRKHGLGRIVSRDDPSGTARLIDSLCADPHVREELARNASAAFRKTYNWEAMAARLEEGYREMFGREVRRP